VPVLFGLVYVAQWTRRTFFTRLAVEQV